MLVGYSNGGALVLKYALDAIEGSGDPQAARIVLLSPMIGVAPFAWLARVISMLGPLPGSRRRAGSTSIPNTTRSSTTRSPPTPGSRPGG